MIDAEFLAKLDGILERVKGHNGVLTISMKELKELHGAQRLKGLVRESIATNLRFKQLGFIGSGPAFDELPSSENDKVRLYLEGTPVARIIKAVLLIGSQGDKQLRDLAGNPSSAAATQELIQKMKLLIAQFDESAP